jgi:hypothetical protein
MTFTTTFFASFLGKPASDVTELSPLNKWKLDRTVDADLDMPVIDYVFPQNGIDLVCDIGDTVTTVFVYNEPRRHFADGLDDLPFNLSRQQVIERLGNPSKSGEGFNDQVLGECGAWDRFENKSHTLHVEYHLDSKSIKKITLMRAGVIP